MHPLVHLTLEALARQMRVEPGLLLDAVEGRPIPRWFAEALVQAYAPGLSLSDFVIEPLTSAPNSDRFGAPVQAELAHKFEGRPATDHPFVNALRARGLTLTEWCATNKVSRVAVKGWYTPGKGARRIPRRWALAIEREFGMARGGKKPLLPATEVVWRNGIKG